MFKRSRWKIILSILAILLLLLAGTFCVIYLASYRDLTNENRALLEQYVRSYTLEEKSDELYAQFNLAETGPFDMPRAELSTFYSVAVSKSNQVLNVDTANLEIMDEEGLTALALDIIESDKREGMEGNLLYLVEDKGGYMLVAFLDNTLMMESAGTLFYYTMIFGGVALVLLFFLSVFLANWIVTPLEERYKGQRQFISDAGHELKTPVAVIQTNLELLSQEMGESPWLSNIRYENDRMSELIAQLLELARTENVRVQMGTIDLSRLVYGEILPFETMAYERGLKLKVDVAENILVHGNDVQLKQLMTILVDNAIQHSSNGNEVCIQLKKEKAQACLCVINDGERIPPEQRKYLFDRFYRADTARTGDSHHYGLGLAIAKAIVTGHKGNIRVQCSGGKVTFIVTLPINRKKK